MDKIDELIKLLKSQEAAGIAKANGIIDAVKAGEFLKLKKEEPKLTFKYNQFDRKINKGG